jgi:hypothetical protein
LLWIKPNGQEIQLVLPNDPTKSKYFPRTQSVHDIALLAPSVFCPYFPVPQLTQADSLTTPTPALHFPKNARKKKRKKKEKKLSNFKFQIYFYSETRSMKSKNKK